MVEAAAILFALALAAAVAASASSVRNGALKPVVKNTNTLVGGKEVGNVGFLTIRQLGSLLSG